MRGLLHEVGPPGENPDMNLLPRGSGRLLSRRSLHSLLPGEDLSGEALDFYVTHLRDRERRFAREALAREETRLGTHFTRSSFVSKLLDKYGTGLYTYNAVKSWRNQVDSPDNDLFGLQRIVIPIHVDVRHWSCACVHVRRQVITYYCSLGSDGKKYTDALLRYLEDEWLTSGYLGAFPLDEWSVVKLTGVPRQMNEFDCGIFVCAYASLLGVGLEDFTFTQSDVSQLRKRLVLEIRQTLDLDGQTVQAQVESDTTSSPSTTTAAAPPAAAATVLTLELRMKIEENRLRAIALRAQKKREGVGWEPY